MVVARVRSPSKHSINCAGQNWYAQNSATCFDLKNVHGHLLHVGRQASSLADLCFKSLAQIALLVTPLPEYTLVLLTKGGGPKEEDSDRWARRSIEQLLASARM